MSSFADLFSGLNFERTIRRFCSDQSWVIAEVNDRKAVLRFNMESGRKQTLFILKYESTLEFSVPSGAQFDSEDEIPDFLSTLLLKRSAQRKIGFWCIEKIGSRHVYSCMHNAEFQLIDSVFFAKVVRALIGECDEFEGELLRLLA
ncbi:MAG: hypothetical protein ABFE08_13840 [Armatimonadia bacterium]